MDAQKRYFVVRQIIHHLERNAGSVYSVNVVEHFPSREDEFETKARYSKKVWFSDVEPLGEPYQKAVTSTYVEFLKTFGIYRIQVQRGEMDHLGAALKEEVLADYINGEKLEKVGGFS